MDLRRIILAVILAALLVAASVLMFSLPGVPRSVLAASGLADPVDGRQPLRLPGLARSAALWPRGF